MLGGMFGGLVHAVATVRFNIDQVISGVVINLFAFFGVRYLSELVYVGKPGGGISQSPPQKWALPKFNLPILSGGEIAGWKSPDFLGWLESQRWFILGDLGGIGRGLTHSISWATVIAVIVVPVSAWVLWRTRFGLRLRSSGESPVAAESLGVKVNHLRYFGLLISGGLAGLAGGTLSIVASSYYRQGQTAGRGFIGLATMIFGNWRPSGILTGALLFGYAEGIKLVASDSITALFLFIAAIAVVFFVLSIVRRKRSQILVTLVVFILSAVAYRTVSTVPESLTQSLPYVVTLIVLATANQRLRPPAMAGVPFRPGEPH
ncbi:MAG: ABC transporter permease [Actinobacteria bacterium]|nr:MAG: ABC transporter permease [Actinomycetota bacterium]